MSDVIEVFDAGSSDFRPSRDVAWDFSDRVVLITGAARGQGAEHARAFAQCGADLVLVDICDDLDHLAYGLGTREELEAVADEVRSYGADCLTSVCDVRSAAQVDQAVAAALARHGRVDVVVSNAGIAGRAPVVDMPLEQWVQGLEVNLRATYYLCRSVAPHMIAAGYGRIVATGSTQSLGSTHDMAHYAASKHGLLGLVRAFARELQPHGVTINLVGPTVVDTPMSNRPPTDERSAWAAEAGRLVGSWNLLQDEMFHPREITEGILWLASEESRGLNGSLLMIDAGCMAK